MQRFENNILVFEGQNLEFVLGSLFIACTICGQILRPLVATVL